MRLHTERSLRKRTCGSSLLQRRIGNRSSVAILCFDAASANTEQSHEMSRHDSSRVLYGQRRAHDRGSLSARFHEDVTRRLLR
jgi:hypothetical protein